MDAYSNTPHEGTNNGAKYCENRVSPTMSSRIYKETYRARYSQSEDEEETSSRFVPQDLAALF
jgi:hypothetical protein